MSKPKTFWELAQQFKKRPYLDHEQCAEYLESLVNQHWDNIGDMQSPVSYTWTEIGTDILGAQVAALPHKHKITCRGAKHSNPLLIERACDCGAVTPEEHKNLEKGLR